MLLASDPPAPDPPTSARCARLDLATWSSLHSPAPPPPPDRPFELDGVLVAELADGIAGYVKLGPVLPIPAIAPRARDQGPQRLPRPPPPRRRPRR